MMLIIPLTKHCAHDWTTVYWTVITARFIYTHFDQVYRRDTRAFMDQEEL